LLGARTDGGTDRDEQDREGHAQQASRAVVSRDETTRFPEVTTVVRASRLVCRHLASWRIAMTARSSRARVPAASALATTLLTLSGCNVGLDPRHFEKVDYGADRARLESVLETEGVARMRFFLPGPEGRPVEYVWLVMQSLYPHPDYAALLEDGRFAALEPVAPRQYPDFSPAMPAWNAAELRARVATSVAQRPSLRWQDLEASDSALPKQGPHPTAAAIEQLILGLPALVLLPIAWPLQQWLIGDADERREHVVGELLTIAPASTYEEVVARIGEPTRRCGDTTADGLMTCVYEIRNGNVWMPGVLVAFEAERLLWIDFFWTHIH
jgi:hypothetical protein